MRSNVGNNGTAATTPTMPILTTPFANSTVCLVEKILLKPVVGLNLLNFGSSALGHLLFSILLVAMPIDLGKELVDLPIADQSSKRSYDRSDDKTLAPWMTPAARLFRPGQRSAIDEADSLGELWEWLKSRDPKSNYDR